MTRIAAYITAYQDTVALNQCIFALENQTIKIDIIYIIDNSPLSLQEKIPNKEYLFVKHYPENIGVGRGLAISINWSINNNYDFLWTFDQDSYPSDKTLEILLSEYNYFQQNKIPVGIISPTIIDSQTNTQLPSGFLAPYQLRWKPPNKTSYYRENLYQCDVVITSGSLINLSAAKQTPLPDPDLFIDGVDWDYCLKLRKTGYHICVTQNTTMQHDFGTYLTSLNQKIPIYIYSPLRYYYINRNHTYIETRLSQNPFYIFLAILYRVKVLIKKLIKIILWEPDQKLLKIAASLLGFFHGIIGKLGKRWS